MILHEESNGAYTVLVSPIPQEHTSVLRVVAILRNPIREGTKHKVALLSFGVGVH